MIRPENTNHRTEIPISTARDVSTTAPPKPGTAPVKIPADAPAISKEKILASPAPEKIKSLASPEKIKSLLSSIPAPAEQSLAEKLKSSRLSPEDLFETISYLV